jgi:F-type H+-transporting ATPase subunit epsilon
VASLHLTVVTPEHKVVETEAEEVQLPGSEGYLGILPGHTPLITLLKTGVLSYRGAGRSGAFAVSAGFAEIVNDRVSVLADLAESASEIDAAAAQNERARAEEEMKTAGVDTLDAIRGRLELAEARLAVAKRSTAA